MITPPRDQIDIIHEENLTRIRSRDVRIAYLYLVRSAESLAGYKCYPMVKGVIYDFRYHMADKQPFAFIVNQESLLFYVRKPAIERFRPRLEELKRRFSEVSQPRQNEITIRIRNLDDAQQLMKEVLLLFPNHSVES